MIEKLKKAGTAFAYGVQSFTHTVTSPPVKALDWLAEKWLGREDEKDSFINFLEVALAEQRSSITMYIKENKALADRLNKYEKNSEENLVMQTEFLAKEARRINALLLEQIQNNEKLNDSNAKMRAAGDAIAELVALNKPKRNISKKDKQIQKAVEDWNKNSR